MKILYKSLIENEIGDNSEIYSINGKKIRFNPTHIDQDGHNPGELIAFSWCTCLQATLKYVLKTKGYNVYSKTTVEYLKLYESNEKKEFRFQYKAILYIDISDKDIRNDLMIEVHNRCPVSKLLKTENITINNKKAH
jgi:osmotically inducible protein OsmC